MYEHHGIDLFWEGGDFISNAIAVFFFPQGPGNGLTSKVRSKGLSLDASNSKVDERYFAMKIQYYETLH
jgi:hypothetical protein